MKVVRLLFKLIKNIVAVNLLHLDGRIIALQMMQQSRGINGTIMIINTQQSNR